MFDTVARVQQLADERQLSLTALAQRCGVNRSTFCTVLRRGGQLKIDTVERICDGLGIPLSEFFHVGGSPAVEPEAQRVRS